MRIGATTRHTNSVLLGIAKVLCGDSASHIANTSLAFDYYSDNSVGALASTEFSFSQEFQEVDILGQKDKKLIPLKASCSLSVSFQELTVRNLAIAMGLNPVSVTYNKILNGTIPLGTDAEPAELRVEAVCVYPDKQNYMAVVFPRAIVRMQTGTSLSDSDNAQITAVFESRYADVKHNGNAVWNSSPLGSIIFDTFNP